MKELLKPYKMNMLIYLIPYKWVTQPELDRIHSVGTKKRCVY